MGGSEVGGERVMPGASAGVTRKSISYVCVVE